MTTWCWNCAESRIPGQWSCFLFLDSPLKPTPRPSHQVRDKLKQGRCPFVRAQSFRLKTLLPWPISLLPPAPL